MTSDKTVSILNNLIRIHNDRITNYDIASFESTELNLKLMFSTFTQSSKRCNEELQEAVRKDRGTPVDITTTDNNHVTFWEELKSSIAGHDNQSIIASCSSAENELQLMYTTILSDNTNNLTTEQFDMIHAQQQLIQLDYDTVKSITSVNKNNN